ncbi:MAG: tetratricopeptide repeat protein [Planctomycetota bacterium]
MKKNIAVCLIVLMVTIIANIGITDIRPDPLHKAESIAPKDNKTVAICLKEEYVNLTLKSEKIKDSSVPDYKLYTEATFTLQNEGEQTALDVGFPMQNCNDLSDFKVIVDGETIPSKEEHNTEIAMVSSSISKTIYYNHWMMWKMDFPKTATKKVIVTYWLRPGLNYGYLEMLPSPSAIVSGKNNYLITEKELSNEFNVFKTGYILKTGADWKGPIGKAVIELKLDGVSKNLLRAWSPDNCKFNRIKTTDSKNSAEKSKESYALTWNLVNFEPTEDINIYFHPYMTIQEELKYFEAKEKELNNVEWFRLRLQALRKTVKKINELDKPEENEELTHYNAGLDFYYANDYQKAIESLKKVIALNPDNSDAYYVLGLAYAGIGDNDSKMESFKTAVSINPNHADANYALALAYAEMGDYKQEIEYLNKVIRIKPNYFEAHWLLGYVYSINLGDFITAIKHYKEAIRIKPDNATLHSNIAVCYLMSDDIESAKKEYEILKTLDAKLAEELYRKIYRR